MQNGHWRSFISVSMKSQQKTTRLQYDNCGLVCNSSEECFHICPIKGRDASLYHVNVSRRTPQTNKTKKYSSTTFGRCIKMIRINSSTNNILIIPKSLLLSLPRVCLTFTDDSRRTQKRRAYEFVAAVVPFMKKLSLGTESGSTFTASGEAGLHGTVTLPKGFSVFDVDMS